MGARLADQRWARPPWKRSPRFRPPVAVEKEVFRSASYQLGRDQLLPAGQQLVGNQLRRPFTVCFRGWRYRPLALRAPASTSLCIPGGGHTRHSLITRRPTREPHPPCMLPGMASRASRSPPLPARRPSPPYPRQKTPPLRATHSLRGTLPVHRTLPVCCRGWPLQPFVLLARPP